MHGLLKVEGTFKWQTTCSILPWVNNLRLAWNIIWRFQTVILKLCCMMLVVVVDIVLSVILKLCTMTLVVILPSILSWYLHFSFTESYKKIYFIDRVFLSSKKSYWAFGKNCWKAANKAVYKSVEIDPTRWAMVFSDPEWFSKAWLQVAIGLPRASQTCCMELKSGNLAAKSLQRISSLSRK